MLRPPYDPLLLEEVKAGAAALPELLDLGNLRILSDAFPVEGVLDARPDLSHDEFAVPRPDGDEGFVLLSVFKSKTSTKTNRPALYFIHGGGQVSGTRFAAITSIMNYFDGIDAVFVSVDYRVAPEYPAPAALTDSHAGLAWTIEHAAELGVDPKRVICERKKPYPFALIAMTPMLDDRDSTVSSKQFARDGPWCGTTNRMAWDHVLGSQRGSSGVSELIVLSRAEDLSGMPPTFIDAGECEVFRDEAVGFALQLWKSGVSTELHIWPGAYHGFDMMTAKAPIAQASRKAKSSWLINAVVNLLCPLLPPVNLTASNPFHLAQRMYVRNELLRYPNDQFIIVNDKTSQSRRFDYVGKCRLSSLL
ncbi:alpha/beta-hydrolase [Cadophora sp. DSE1049]|nr:alpha/beta-hydrolase [Cadophora sp. DSE1049]